MHDGLSGICDARRSSLYQKMHCKDGSERFQVIVGLKVARSTLLQHVLGSVYIQSFIYICSAFHLLFNNQVFIQKLHLVVKLIDQPRILQFILGQNGLKINYSNVVNYLVSLVTYSSCASQLSIFGSQQDNYYGNILDGVQGKNKVELFG